MRAGLIPLALLAALAGCGSESKVDRQAAGHAVDVAAQADSKAREDAASAIEQRSTELRGRDETQAKKLEEQARAMRDRNKAELRS